MKNILATIILSITTISPAVAATSANGLSEQMQAQMEQLRPHAFNFFSDRYKQMQVMKTAMLTFKQQLDSQTELLRPQHFNPKSDAYRQIQARES